MNKDFKFEDLYEAIYKILPNEDLQELMDVCYEITGVPILIVDIMYNVYGLLRCIQSVMKTEITFSSIAPMMTNESNSCTTMDLSVQ